MFANRDRGAMKCNGGGKAKKNKQLNREAATMTVAIVRIVAEDPRESNLLNKTRQKFTIVIGEALICQKAM